MRRGDGWFARCPAHDDRQPPLSVGVGDDGKVLLCGHVGCSFAAVFEALDLPATATAEAACTATWWDDAEDRCHADGFAAAPQLGDSKTFGFGEVQIGVGQLGLAGAAKVLFP